MFDAVFISDLHLHPQEPTIMARFHDFVAWAARHTRAVYILGDFLHVWPGDEAIDAWSEAIAARLEWLAKRGIDLYFLPGNRDFLLGQRFMQRARLQCLTEPSIILLGNEQVLLVHGDRYCTHDKSHQWLRYLTRNRIFPLIFRQIPYRWRAKLVQRVRHHSQANRQKTMAQMDVVPATLLFQLCAANIRTVIHGHIHKPGLTRYLDKAIVPIGDKMQSNGNKPRLMEYAAMVHKIGLELPASPTPLCEHRQYVLSDWDENPWILCYNEADGYRYIQI